MLRPHDDWTLVRRLMSRLRLRPAAAEGVGSGDRNGGWLSIFDPFGRPGHICMQSCSARLRASESRGLMSMAQQAEAGP